MLEEAPVRVHVWYVAFLERVPVSCIDSIIYVPVPHSSLSTPNTNKLKPYA